MDWQLWMTMSTTSRTFPQFGSLTGTSRTPLIAGRLNRCRDEGGGQESCRRILLAAERRREGPSFI